MSNKKQKSNGKNIAVIIICAILALVLVVILAAYLILKSYIGKVDIRDKNEYFTGAEVTNEQVGESIDGPTIAQDVQENIENAASEAFSQGEVKEADYVRNIVLIGTDNRHFEDISVQPGNSDVIILLSINDKTKQIYMTSIMRDTYVYVDYPEALQNRWGYKDGSYQINIAHARGGAKLLLDTIQGNFKIKVDEYVCVDFYSLIDIIDILGGIPMNVTDEEAKWMYNYIRDMDFDRGVENPETANTLSGGGDYILNGVQAVAYARQRYSGGSDYARTQRQRAVLEQVFIKAKSMSLTQLNNLANTILPKVSTNISADEIMNLVSQSVGYLSYDLEQMRVPFDGMYSVMNINGTGVLVPDYEATSNKLIETIFAE